MKHKKLIIVIASLIVVFGVFMACINKMENKATAEIEAIGAKNNEAYEKLYSEAEKSAQAENNAIQENFDKRNAVREKYNVCEKNEDCGGVVMNFCGNWCGGEHPINIKNIAAFEKEAPAVYDKVACTAEYRQCAENPVFACENKKCILKKAGVAK